MKAGARVGPVTSWAVSVSLGKSASVSLVVTRVPPPTSEVAVPPSATVMLSATATGVLSFTGVMLMETVAVLLVWLTASVTR